MAEGEASGALVSKRHAEREIIAGPALLPVQESAGRFDRPLESAMTDISSSPIGARGYARPEALVSTTWVAEHLADLGQ